MRLKKISILMLSTVLVTSNISYAIPSNSAYKSIEVYKGQVHLPNKEWKEKIEYIVGQDNIPFDYDSTHYYEDENYSGILKAKKVIITPKQKIENKDKVTVYKEFNKSQSGVYKSNNDINFPTLYPIDEDGYKGFINRTSVSWTPNWVRGEKVNYEKSHTTGWLTGEPPNTISDTYNHKESNQSIKVNLTLKKIKNKEVGKSYKYSESSGNRYNYSRDNEKLGYMSQNNKTYYWKKTYNFSDAKPLKPNDYWGSEPDKENWETIDWAWDEDRAYSADELSKIPSIKKHLTYQNGSWWWKSLSGTLNKYRKGVWIKYRKQIPVYRYTGIYGTTVSIPDYIRDYNGTAKYKGVLSKEEERISYTSNYWDVKIIYEGDTSLKDVMVNGSIIPNPSPQGSQITFDINTRFYPNKIEILIPNELKSYFNKSSIVINIDEEIYLNTKYSEVLDLYIPQTIDKDGNRIKDPYEFIIIATRSDGNKQETKVQLEISGSILDNLKTMVIN